MLSALTLVVTGCGGNADPSGDATGAAPAATSAAPVDAKEELSAAARKLNETTMKINLTAPGTKSSGSLDPKRRLGDMTMTVAGGGRQLKILVRTIGNDVYLQSDNLPGAEKGKWLKIDGSRIAGSTLDVYPESDPAGTGKLLDALSDIKKDGPGQFSGTIDLTKASPNPSVASLGDKVKALPFAAKVDDEGRLTSTEIDMTSISAAAGKTTATYSGFGSPVSVEPPPAGKTVPASDEVVKMLTGG